MRDQKVRSLPKFERLHIGGWGMAFYKQHCYMFQVTRTQLSKYSARPLLQTALLHVSGHTHTVKQIQRPATSSVKNNRTHTSEAANQFAMSLHSYQSYSILNERAFARSSRICSWAGRELACFGVCLIHVLLN